MQVHNTLYRSTLALLDTMRVAGVPLVTIRQTLTYRLYKHSGRILNTTW